jgi:hypothetical protein
LATTAGGLGVGAGGVWAHAAVNWKATAAGTKIKVRRRAFIGPRISRPVDRQWMRGGYLFS